MEYDLQTVATLLENLRSELGLFQIEATFSCQDITDNIDEFQRKATSSDEWREDDWERLLRRICAPLLLSDSLHKLSIQLIVQLIGIIGKKISTNHIADALCPLVKFLGSESSASEDQIIQKVKAVDSILSSQPDILSLICIQQDLEKLILDANSSKWERLQVKRWILKLIPKVLKAKDNFLSTLKTSCEVGKDHIEWLCAASNFVFAEGNEGFFLNLLEDNFLWKVISIGLVDKENYIRKRSLYLLKRSTDKVINGSIDCNKSDVSDPMVLMDSVPYKQSKLWDNYFLIIETLDEKQVHIVKQVLGSIEDLLDYVPSKGPLTSSQSFHITWILVLYRILFNHQNNAIVIWSVENFMKTLSSSHLLFDHELLIQSVCDPFLDALNLTKMFEDAGPEKCRIGMQLEVFLSRFCDLKDRKVVNKFWSQFLSAGFKKLTGPAPIFYFARAVLNSLSGRAVSIDRNCVQSIKEFCEFRLKCQDPMIKGYVQASMLKVGMLCWEEPKGKDPLPQEIITEAADFLMTFHGSKKVLIKGTPLWVEASQWLCRLFALESDKDVNCFIEYLETSSNNEFALGSGKIGFLAVLLCDGVVDGQAVLTDLVHKALCGIKDRLYRSYAAPITFQLSKLASIFRAKNVGRLPENRLESTPKISDNDEKSLAKAINDYVVGLDPLVHQHELDDAVCVLNEVQMSSQLHEILVGHISFLTLGSPSSEKEIKEKIISIIVVSSFAPEVLKDQAAVTSIKRATIEGLFPVNVMVAMAGQIGNREDQRIWCELSSQATLAQWRMIESCMDFVLKQKDEDENRRFVCSVFSQASFWLPVAGTLILQPLLSATKKALDAMESNIFLGLVGDLEKFLDQCERSVFETRKSDIFWKSFQSLVEFAFSPSLIMGLPKRVLKLAIRIFKDAETVQGMSDIFMRNFLSLVENGMNVKDVHEDLLALILVETCCYGPSLRRDQRVVSKINAAIESEGFQQPVNLYEVSDHLDQSRVRTKGLRLLLLASLSEDFPTMKVIEEICKKCEPLAQGNAPKCFENSPLHLKLTRSFQLLLIIATIVCKTENASCVDSIARICLLCFVSENQRPSIKYFAEWILVTISVAFPTILSPILDSAFDEAKEVRLSCAPAFFAITVQQALHLRDRDSLESAMAKLMPWTMGQHFGTRLEAQICCLRLYKDLAMITDQSPYKVFAESIQESFKTGDVAKNMEKINSNFFSSTFDPKSCMNLENIFYDLPRLCKLDLSEWIPKELLHQVIQENNLSIPLSHPDSPWTIHINSQDRNCYCCDCLHVTEILKDQFEIFNVSDGDTIQKKITPWKEMLDAEEVIEDRVAAHPDLILVASLVDRPPNLGGLCRTSEILGVGQYIVGNSAIITDREFQSLSVTAQNWLNVVEVRPNDLLDYFKEKKGNGYRIVGVEQTQDSISLEKYKFDRKTVLVLGNEKEGIPMDLIQEMDDCVEIPQSGMVRSLNVHVSGALVVWEYVRQGLIHM